MATSKSNKTTTAAKDKTKNIPTKTIQPTVKPEETKKAETKKAEPKKVGALFTEMKEDADKKEAQKQAEEEALYKAQMARLEAERAISTPKANTSLTILLFFLINNETLANTNDVIVTNPANIKANSKVALAILGININNPPIITFPSNISTNSQ